MSDKPLSLPENPALPHPRSGLAAMVRRLIPAITSATVAGLLLGMIVVGISWTGPESGHDLAAAPAPAGNAGPFDIELGDLYVKPSSINVPPGAAVVLRVRNAGKMDHSLELDGKGGKMLAPGQSETLNWGPFTASAKAWCTVAGHKDSGMTLDIIVGAAPAAGAENAATDSPDSSSAKIDFAAKPGPDWRPYDPAVAPAPGGARHDITLNAQELEQEVAPGVKQLRWTFNGQVPGPTLRGKVGDLFTVTLVNKGSMAHSIDFHASKVAPNVEMRPIKPGEKLVYQFKADFAGIFYYHCGTDPMIHHIANGMYGALIVDPPNLAPVAKEIVLEQSELYLGPSGQPGDLKKMLAQKADAVVFNGYVNQYIHSPVQVRRGDRVRIWVLNAGINEITSFHVIGSIFDTVYKEGSYTLRPDASHGGGQALDLMPAQGGFVEFTLDRDGTYIFVNHKMSAAHKGAMGFLQVGASK